MKRAFEIMTENEFREWVLKIYGNMVLMSGIKTKRSSLTRRNFDETTMLNDSEVKFSTPKAGIANSTTMTTISQAKSPINENRKPTKV